MKNHQQEIHELMQDTEDILFRKISEEAAQMVPLLHGQTLTETLIRRLMDSGAAIALKHANELARESNRVARGMQE